MQPAYIRVNHRSQTPTLDRALNQAIDWEDHCPVMASENYIAFHGQPTPPENGHHSRIKGNPLIAKATIEETHTLFGICENRSAGSDCPEIPPFFDNAEPSLDEYNYSRASFLPRISPLSSTNPTPRLSSTPLGSPQREDRSWRFPPEGLTPETSFGDSSPPPHKPSAEFPLRIERECTLRTSMRNVAQAQRSNNQFDEKLQEEFLRINIKNISNELYLLLTAKSLKTQIDTNFSAQEALMKKLAALGNQVLTEYGTTIEKFFNNQN